MIEHVRRLWCRYFGHRAIIAAAEPVVGPFNVCLRCGKWWRRG